MDEKTVGGSNRMKPGGDAETVDPSSHCISPMDVYAAPKTGEMAARKAAGLSAMTMTIKGVAGWSGAASITLWGKEPQSNLSNARAMDEFSKFVAHTMNALPGIDVMEVAWRG